MRLTHNRADCKQINFCQLPLSVPPSTYAIRLHSTVIPLEQPNRLLRQLRSSGVPERPSKRPLKIIGTVEDDAPTKRACITATNVLPLIPLSCQYPDLHPHFVHTLEEVRQRAYGFFDKDSTNSRFPSLKDRQRNVDIQLVFYADRLFGLRNMNRITNLLHTIVLPMQRFSTTRAIYQIEPLQVEFATPIQQMQSACFCDKSGAPFLTPLGPQWKNPKAQRI